MTMSDFSVEHCRAELERITREAMNCADALREILTAERQALARQDAMVLENTASDKAACVEKLEQLESERANLSAACGFGSTPDDMKSLLRWCDQNASLKDRWEQFLAVAAACRSLNASNGSIIRLRHSQITNALAILRGDESETELYGPEGRTGTNSGRALAEA